MAIYSRAAKKRWAALIAGRSRDAGRGVALFVIKPILDLLH
jgi:hypothetical protein